MATNHRPQLLLILLILCPSMTLGLRRTGVGNELTQGPKVPFYGHCQVSQDCGNPTESSLSCRRGRCDCDRPNDMIYDSRNGRCLVKTEKPCDKDRDECVPNTFCSLNGKCECLLNLRKGRDGTCMSSDSIKTYGQPCNDPYDECDFEFEGIGCINSVCQCDPRSSVPSFEFFGHRGRQNSSTASSSGSCLILAGKSCLSGETKLKCVPGATCSSTTGLCECERSEGGTPVRGHCKGSKGDPCGPGTIPCEDQLDCVNGRCRCGFPAHQDPGTCLSMIRGPCDLEDKLTVCIETASCAGQKCACKDGFVENFEGTCDMSFNQPCLNDSVLMSGTTGVGCDREGPLVCKNGKCDCSDRLENFDPVQRKCRRKEGGFCVLDKDCDVGLKCELTKIGRRARGQCSNMTRLSIQT